MTVNMETQNNTLGAGAIDSWHQVANSCMKVQKEHGADLAAVAVELTINIVSGVLDTVALVLDPFGKLIAAGLGWMIEHIAPLKEVLDQIAGDPAEITKVANELHKIGESLRMTGEDLDNNLKSMITKWHGEGHDSFVKSINDRKGWIDANAKAADVAGYMVETTGAMVGALRALIRDIFTTVLGDIIATMLLALVLAPETLGASIVAGVTKCVAATTATVASAMAKLAKAMAFGGRTLARLNKLAAGLRSKPNPSAGSHELDSLPSGSRPGSPPHDDGTPPPAHQDGDGTPPPAHNQDGDGTPPPAHNEDGGATPPPHQAGDGTPPPAHNEEGGGTPPAHEDDPYDLWLKADDHFNGPGGRPHDEGTPPPRQDGDGTPPPHGDGTPPPHGDGTPPAHQDGDGTPPPAQQDGGGTPPAQDGGGTPPPAHQDGGGTPPPSPPPVTSKLSNQDIGAIKAHEGWLAKTYPEGDAARKWVDNWVKANRPDYYPMLKAMSDAKSSKNWAGWAGKSFVQIDRGLTDIQMQADAAWAEEQKNQKSKNQEPPPK